jgi:hypothetical protein
VARRLAVESKALAASVRKLMLEARNLIARSEGK